MRRMAVCVSGYLLALASLALIFLAACTPSSSPVLLATPAAPAAIPTTRAAPTPTQLRPSALDVFPLQLGATWVYSVTVDYEENQRLVHWTGMIAETISSVTERGDAIVFGVEYRGSQPDLPSWLVATDRYVARGERIYQLSTWDKLDGLLNNLTDGSGFSQFIQWPLHVGQQWGDPQYIARNDGFYVWRADAQEDVTTPAGTFSCYRLLFLTNPDHTLFWFCPGIGLARREYHHHGTRQDELWELTKR